MASWMMVLFLFLFDRYFASGLEIRSRRKIDRNDRHNKIIVHSFKRQPLPQHQSDLVQKLPTEIRQIIYGYVLGNRFRAVTIGPDWDITKHVESYLKRNTFYRWTTMKHIYEVLQFQRERKKRYDQFIAFHDRTHERMLPENMMLPLKSTCQILYHDVSAFQFSQMSYLFGVDHTMDLMKQIPSVQYHALTKLEVTSAFPLDSEEFSHTVLQDFLPVQYIPDLEPHFYFATSFLNRGRCEPHLFGKMTSLKTLRFVMAAKVLPADKVNIKRSNELERKLRMYRKILGKDVSFEVILACVEPPFDLVEHQGYWPETVPSRCDVKLVYPPCICGGVCGYYMSPNRRAGWGFGVTYRCVQLGSWEFP